jgi:hypothetical protein
VQRYFADGGGGSGSGSDGDSDSDSDGSNDGGGGGGGGSAGGADTVVDLTWRLLAELETPPPDFEKRALGAVDLRNLVAREEGTG